MKSQRRHELQHNALANWLAESAQAIRPYQNILVTAVVLAAAGVLAYAVWTRAAAAQTAQAWDMVNASLGTGDVSMLSSVIEKYPDSRVSRVSAVVAGDLRLARGCSQLFAKQGDGGRRIEQGRRLVSNRFEASEIALAGRASHVWPGPRR